MTCKKVGEAEISIKDGNIDCNSDYFNNMVKPISIICIVIMGGILPSLLGIKLFSLKNSIANLSVKEKFGYLYLEYKPKYFWFEIYLTISVKIKFIIFTIVFTFYLSYFLEYFKYSISIINKNRNSISLDLGNNNFLISYNYYNNLYKLFCYYRIPKSNK